MKFTLYIDTYPGMDPGNVWAFARPSVEKSLGAKRYSIEFELPVEEVDGKTENVVVTEVTEEPK